MYAICAHTSIDKLVAQAREFHPEVVCIGDEQLYPQLKEALADMPVKVWAGADAIAEMVTFPCIDIVVAAMVGYAGLRPTIEAIREGKTIALANKETLVVAGELICRLAIEHHAAILPVDSEHSAIFQSLAGEQNNEIEKILLTGERNALYLPHNNDAYYQSEAFAHLIQYAVSRPQRCMFHDEPVRTKGLTPEELKTIPHKRYITIQNVKTIAGAIHLLDIVEHPDNSDQDVPTV